MSSEVTEITRTDRHRPRAISAEPDGPDWVSFGGDTPGTDVQVRYRGPHTDYAVVVAGGTLLVRETVRTCRSPGETVTISIKRTWSFGR